ncbi:DUF3006 domain-containing protein [Desulfotomaculum sp. 1211_IL3151]|uniref:DUF3006 domain-containing protein n=1 Tax=Desulfotomaculum sp. 1211_IL3151 TaxID=3084055 RepID=UPI002FDB3399
MRAVIDRFEADWAVLEVSGKIMWQVPRSFLPPEAKEGSKLEVNFTILDEGPEDELFEEVFK